MEITLKTLSEVYAENEAAISSLVKEITSFNNAISEYDSLIEPNNIYYLHSVLVHANFSESVNSGHYWCYVKDHSSNQWYKCNDTTVTKVEESTVFSGYNNANENPSCFFYVSEDYRNSCKSLADDKIQIPEHVLSQIKNSKKNVESHMSKQQQQNAQIQKFISMALMQHYAQSQNEKQ